ncbi:hypothetical protein [Serratia sp. M24T3]|uniref:hypothetical protein n=1 Tax=Serratia sp. M24T3 TaxID=932213 RepID=UPI000319991A|nr:hypothetical protein [Serratia sp. M24T3]
MIFITRLPSNPNSVFKTIGVVIALIKKNIQVVSETLPEGEVAYNPDKKSEKAAHVF